MTQYLLSLPHDSAEEPTMASMDPADLEAAMAAAGAFLEELTAAGALVFAGGLHPPSTAVTVDHTGDDLVRAEGPYTQAPEYLGGLWVVEAPDQEAAVAWAAKAAEALGARIEVRAFQEVPDR
ncbi:YciI family protein [Blastococcus sp. SYSU D00813]